MLPHQLLRAGPTNVGRILETVFAADVAGGGAGVTPLGGGGTPSMKSGSSEGLLSTKPLARHPPRPAQWPQLRTGPSSFKVLRHGKCRSCQWCSQAQQIAQATTTRWRIGGQNRFSCEIAAVSRRSFGSLVGAGEASLAGAVPVATSVEVAAASATPGAMVRLQSMRYPSERRWKQSRHLTP
jgi:hypothetical protein